MNSPIRVLHLIGQLTRGGCELQLSGMIPHLNRSRIESTVATFWSGGDELVRRRIIDAGCPIIDLDKRKHIDGLFMLRLTRLIRRVCPDVIHAWLISAGLWGRLAAMLAAGRLPTIVSYRSEGSHNWPGGMWLDRFLSLRTSLAIANSTRIHEIWQRRLNWSRERIRVIANGVDFCEFHPASRDQAARAAVGLPANKFLVTMVGRMNPVKNWPAFIDLANRVTARCPEAAFLAVGGGELLDEMQQLAARRGLSRDHILFLGSRTDVARILAVSNLAVSTSAHEGMSNAILEAMSCGLPVIATMVSGSTELVRDGETGFLVPPGDVAAMADRVTKLCHCAELAALMGKAARQIALAQHSFRRMADLHELAYCEAVEAEAHRRS